MDPKLIVHIPRRSRRLAWRAASTCMTCMAAGALMAALVCTLAAPASAQPAAQPPEESPAEGPAENPDGAADGAAAPHGERTTDRWLPAETKGYLAVPDLQELEARWDRIELGKMFALPQMEPFLEDLQRQIDTKITQTGTRLGLQWDDLSDIQRGEVGLASIQPEGDEKRYALALLVDVAGNEAATQAVLEKVARNMRQRNAEQRVIPLEGVEVVAYTLPKERGEVQARQAFHALTNGWLIAADQEDVMEGILARIAGKNGPSLSNHLAYAVVQQRSQDQAGAMPLQIRWFLEPLGYAQVARASGGGREQRGRDKLKVVQRQGFDAIQGAGGIVSLDVQELDIVHHAYIFAPPVEPDKRFELAARMLDFPNAAAVQVDPQPWVPVDIAAYLTLHWKMQDAFYYSKSLVNDLADDKVFDDIWESIAQDENGPRVDVPKEIIAKLGERLTVLVDRTLPINERSEHRLFAFELRDSESVKATISRAMRRDPGVKEIKHGEHLIWQIVSTKRRIDAPQKKKGFRRFGKKPQQPKPNQQPPILKSGGAITVAYGQLIYASDIGLITRILAEDQKLEDFPDYQAVQRALDQLGSGKDSYRYFARTALTNHTNWELFRAKKLPEADSAFAKLLNFLMGTSDEDVTRKVEFDGSKLPPFEQVRRFMGPSGFYMRSEEDGWLIVGCLLEPEE